MARRPAHKPLRVLLNNRLTGYFTKGVSGETGFQYHQSWLDWEHALPISLSLPLRKDAYRGEAVASVFDNLLPDTDALRRRVAERVGAAGVDAYSMLAAIGRDCVGALRFLEEAGDVLDQDETTARGEVVDDAAIDAMLKGLSQAPLGLRREDAFRISVAGAQEKTALLRRDGQWLKPLGSMPTTHILKPPIGVLPGGVDLSRSVENEFYCLKLAAAFRLPAAHAEIGLFGTSKALVVERFDRRWTRDGRLIRVPQEDCCQALSVPSTRKYQSEGGPGLVDILDLLKGSDAPARDQAIVLKAQILFWLIGATDGHAKNFSVFLGPRGSYYLTPLYDVLTMQPSVDAGQIEPRQFRLAMSVGTQRHYRIDEIVGRHFAQTVDAAGLSPVLVREALAEMTDTATAALDRVENDLPADFPDDLHASVRRAVVSRLNGLTLSGTRA